jgi:hypothetical protein
LIVQAVMIFEESSGGRDKKVANIDRYWDIDREI